MPQANLDDIREWGKENGWDVSGDRLPNGLRAAFDGREQEEPETVKERPPAVAAEGRIERAKGLVQKARLASTPKKSTGRIARARIPVTKVIETGWKALAAVAGNWNPAVSRMLTMQAPVAGVLLEESVRNTIVDKALQPVARFMSGGEMATALIGPPLLVAALTIRPDRQDIIIPLLRTSLQSWVKVAGPKMETLQKEAKESEQTDAEIEELLRFVLEPMMKPVPEDNA